MSNIQNPNEEFNILVITPNNLVLDANFDPRQIYPYLHLMKTNREELMYVLYDLLELTPETVGDSDIVYENDQFVYQIFHNSENLHQTEEEGKLAKLSTSITPSFNGIATYLVNSEKKINGRVVLLRSKILSNGLCDTSSINQDDMFRLLHKTFVHQGTIININELIINFSYQSPLDGISESLKQNYSYVETDVYGFHLIGCYDSTLESKESINKKASLLFNTKLHGNVRVCITTDSKFIDMEEGLIDNLLYCSLQTAERKYTGSEDLPQRINDMTVIKNGYTLLKKKVSTFKVSCFNPQCSETCNVNEKSIETYSPKCEHCHKAYYHNDECKLIHKEEHEKVCFGLN